MQDMNCDEASLKDAFTQHGEEHSMVPKVSAELCEQAVIADDKMPDVQEVVYAEDEGSLRAVDNMGRELAAALPTQDFQGFPVNNLPLEVLQHIFSWCIAGFDPIGVVRGRNAITSVCSLWRDAIRGSPEIWTFIPVIGLGPFDPAFACAKRSKALPLKIHIDQRDPYWNGDEKSYSFGPNDMTSLLDGFSRYYARIEELHVIVDTWTVMQSALSWLHTHPAPPMLKRLELRRHGPQYVIIEGPPPAGLAVPGMTLFGGSMPPMLKHVNFSGVHVNWDNTALEGLHHLSLRKLAVELAPSLPAFRSILQRSPCLENLLLLDASPVMMEGQEAFEGLPPIKLDYLTDLSVGRLTLEHAIYVFSQINAPNLRRLTLSAFNSDDYGPLFKKITGAFPALTVLFVENFETEDQASMYEFLKSIPNLRYLKIGGLAVEFFQALCSYVPVPANGNNLGQDAEEQWWPICPYLETVEFTDVEFDVLQWFHDYRCGMGAPLQQLFISFRLLPKLKQADLRWLVDLGSNVVRLVPNGSVPYNDPKYLS